MILISHRGNIDGPNSKRENDPDYIVEALYNYEVEIDLWFIDGMFKLGHDEPQHEIQYEFLLKNSRKLWIHCKNLLAFRELSRIDPAGDFLNYFVHESDDVVFTSKGYRWALVGKQPIENSIAVMPEVNDEDIAVCSGICSDYIGKYR
jgi:hypothetical protein